MKKTLASLAVAGMLAATVALGGCGGQKAADTSSTTQATTQEQEASTSKTESTSTEKTSTSEPAKTETSTAANTSTTSTTTESAAPAQTQQISADQAKEIALKDAGLSAADVTELKAELDTDDAVVHYDVEFKHAGQEYDYDIEAATGAIMSHSVEVDD